MKVMARRFLKTLIYSVRRFFPKLGYYTYSGYLSHLERRILFDYFLRQVVDQFQNKTDYEAGIMNAMASSVLPGDSVVIVGGGSGITACQAKQLVGEDGRVICYEPSVKQREAIHKTLNLNGFEGAVDVISGSVGPEIGIYHDDITAKNYHPSELPVCDVLQLDCEGAEVEIIKNLGFKPRVIAVECHGFLGAPSDKVKKILEINNYKVADMGVAEPSKSEFCVKNDITVLLGTKDV